LAPQFKRKRLINDLKQFFREGYIDEHNLSKREVGSIYSQAMADPNYYLIKQDGTTLDLHKEGFNSVRKFFSDCMVMQELLSKEKFTRDQISVLVEFYNKNCP
jgi:hypothetical protein